MLGHDFEMPENNAPSGVLRVLFVDDEARILRALKALFRDLETFITSDPREAPQLAARHDIDVVVCDQRMPEMLGVDVLREIRASQPRAMRILLTGYSDLKAVLGSVNEGEVYRFVNKPWVNSDLRALVLEAGSIAREAPVVATDQLSPNEQNIARSQVGVLVIEDDPTVQQRLREILQPHYQVRFANTAERALQVLEQHETGVVISETATNHGADLTLMLKALKQYHPHIATVVITERANAQTVIELINEGQVYRMLIKPVRMGSCRLSIDSALGRYWKLKQTPQAVRRYGVTPTVETMQAQAKLPNSLLSRIRSLPARLFGAHRV
ncbi:response regulator [Tahibacter amnicola]|uniref:Response regulator n=1 Tax=Tahibacter amnicola TaxID=2976241 RepID=A0ABY6BKD3_9GAMM|nr:response regulator [Tahibacter amnicola]UXI68845.1 response regulator [Tahibacter amnicola]